MTIPFEPTRSYVYQATRYELLPEIQKRTGRFGDVPFLLRDIWKPLLAETYQPEQLEIRIKKERSDATEKMGTIFGWYIHFLASNLKFFENLGEGMFRNISLDEEVAEADDETPDTAADAEDDGSGIIYAYTFPSIRKDGRFPIKVGRTMAGDAEARVAQQCRQACCFEHPIVLGSWPVHRVAAVEVAVQRTLEARGFKRDAPGTEWFNTTLDEVESIVTFIQTQGQ
jgi:T5orf172 domain